MEIIDVSKWQGAIDWATVRKKNPLIHGVYIKATEGINYMDPFLKANALMAFKHGFQVGYYHFASLNTINVINDAGTEARAFLKAIDGLPNDLPLVLDLEKNAVGLSKDQVLSWIKAFFTELELQGHQNVMLYSYTPFLNAVLPLDHGLGAIKLWIAAYAAKPKIPMGWLGYYLWQYSCTGKVPGIKGNVDLNTF